MAVRVWALAALLTTIALCVHAQTVPLNSLSAAVSQASTDTLPVCQVSGGCGSPNSLAKANAQTYILGPGVFSIIAYGADPTGGADSTTAIQNAINAAVAYSPVCGTTLLPPGKYKISSTITYGTTAGCKFLGLGGRSYDADNGATIFTTANITNMMTVNATCTGSNVQAGPTIDGVTFDDQSGHNNTALYMCNIMRFQIKNNSFRNANVGVFIDSSSGSGADNSDASTFSNIFYKNNIGYEEQNLSTGGGGQNTFHDNYVIANGAGTIGVECLIGSGGGTGSFSIVNNRFDGAGTAIYNTCYEVAITGGNRIEGGWTVAIQNVLSGGNAGKQVTVTGNIFNTPGGNPHNNTCTPVTTGTTWLCSATTGYVVGMELHGTGIPTFSMGTFAAGTNNLLKGGTYITAIPDGTHITASQVASSNPGAETVGACNSVYNIDPASTTFAIVGNVYADPQECQTVYGFAGQ